MARRKKDDLGTPQLGGALDIKISEMAGAKGFGGGSTGGKGFFKAKPRKSNDTSWFKGTKKGKEALKIRMAESEQGREIAESTIPRTKGAENKLWQPGDNIPTPFDISKTKPGSPQRGAVIKSANEAKVNQQGHVIIEGKGVNRADVPQHKDILSERLKFKSKRMEEHKAKPGYQEKQDKKRKQEESVRLNAPKPTTSEIKASKKQERKVTAIAKLKLQQEQGLRQGVKITPQKLDKDTGLQISPSKIKSKGRLTRGGKNYYKNKSKKKSTGDPIPF